MLGESQVNARTESPAEFYHDFLQTHHWLTHPKHMFYFWRWLRSNMTIFRNSATSHWTRRKSLWANEIKHSQFKNYVRKRGKGQTNKDFWYKESYRRNWNTDQEKGGWKSQYSRNWNRRKPIKCISYYPSDTSDRTEEPHFSRNVNTLANQRTSFETRTIKNIFRQITFNCQAPAVKSRCLFYYCNSIPEALTIADLWSTSILNK